MSEKAEVLYRDRFIPKYNEVRQQLVDKGYTDFVEVTEQMYRDYKAKDGHVSCDNSTKGEHLDLKVKFLTLMAMIDADSIGRWSVYWCDTCERHSEEHPYHCEIVRNFTN